MEYFFEPFKSFHPLKGKVPEVLKDDFQYIAKKARKIIKGRKKSEIDYAMKSVNWILEMGDLQSSMRKLTDDIVYEISEPIGGKNKKKSKSKKYLTDYHSPAAMLLDNIGKYDITGQAEFPNAIYSEYFAILALAIIDVTSNLELQIRLNTKLDKDDYNQLKTVSHFALNAMEAIGIAELLNSNKLNELIDKKTKRKLRLQAQMGGFKKNEENNKLKIELVKGVKAFRKNNMHLKKTQAARKYYRGLPKTKRDFAEDYAIKFLVTSLTDD